MPTFTDQFKAADGGPIHFNGRELSRNLMLSVSRGDKINLRFLRSADKPVQGIGIKCDKCEISVVGTKAKTIALWTDTAPKDVLIQVQTAAPGAQLSFVNQWRDEKYGSTMYHLNDAAMELQKQPDGSIVARCSDGWGEPDFNDLIFQVIQSK